MSELVKLPPAGLVLQGVTLSVAGNALLRGFDLSVRPGEAVALMGPSGSGKSSLLHWLAGSLPPGFSGEGVASVNGERLNGLPPERRRVGILFQDPLLFEHMSVGQNLRFALPKGVPRRERAKAVAEALAGVGLAGLDDARPGQLSGGQRARAALARTLLSNPRALLLDEPFSGLDRPLRQGTRELVLRQAALRGLPVLLVTHDDEDAAAAHRTVRPFAGGRAESAEAYSRP